jgi:hypothetical protein
LNNPVMYADPSGNIPWDTIIDVGWTVYEGVKAIISPTEENMNNFKWSLASIFIPYMPGSYAKHAADGLGGAFSKGSKSTSKSTSNSGSKTSKNVAETGSKGTTKLTKRDELLGTVSNKKLKNTINEIYRPGATTGDGGLADAISVETKYGQLVGGKSHIQKGWERVRNLENIMRNEKLSDTDWKIANDLVIDLKRALNGK